MLLLLSVTKKRSVAERTSHDSCYSTDREWSAFRRVGCAVQPVAVSTRPLSSTWRSDDDNVRRTAVGPQQHLGELPSEDSEDANEASGLFDSRSPRYTAAVNSQCDGRAAPSSLDRVANLSVYFPSPLPSITDLTRKLRAAQRNHRRATKDIAISAVPSRENCGGSDHVTSFDDLPDWVVSRVFASGLDSCELCRCGLVCRRWNVLVWRDSRLWTTIDLGGRQTLDVDCALRSLMRAVGRTAARLQCLGVQAVTLPDCHRLTDVGLRTVAKRCADLRRLDVSSCPLITDTAVFDVLARCVNLQHLDIAGIYRSVSYTLDMYSFASLAYFEEYHYNQTSPSCMQQSLTLHVIKSVLLSRPF